MSKNKNVKQIRGAVGKAASFFLHDFVNWDRNSQYFAKCKRVTLNKQYNGKATQKKRLNT